eukprot:Nitzschia sp. Nitz4//scaffold15_size197535//158997//159431//NITZ4_001601-RA/size197535-processed-gene-0.95-mRNA-1//-1//CDS//3329537784//6012//frame0
MIRSARIPTILSRITADHVIQSAVLVTSDGELLGATSQTFVGADGTRESMEHLGTLIADIAVDYQRLGDEYVQVTPTSEKKKSHLQCLLLEMEYGLVAVSACAGVDCLVIGIAAPDAPMGMIKARLQAMTEHVQEALAPLQDTV